MATNSQGDNISKTVSMETAMWAAAEARQKALGFRAFSAYVQSLLRKDLAERPDIVMSENKGGYSIRPHGHELNEKTNSSLSGESAAARVAAAALAEVRRESGQRLPPAGEPSSVVRSRSASGLKHKK